MRSGIASHLSEQFRENAKMARSVIRDRAIPKEELTNEPVDGDYDGGFRLQVGCFNLIEMYPWTTTR